MDANHGETGAATKVTRLSNCSSSPGKIFDILINASLSAVVSQQNHFATSRFAAYSFHNTAFLHQLEKNKENFDIKLWGSYKSG